MNAIALIGSDAGLTEYASCTLARDVLVAQYQPLHQRLRRHFGCADMASECLHDAWLKLGDLPASDMQMCGAYIYRVACNIAADRVRSNRPWCYADDADQLIDQMEDLAPGPDMIAELHSDLVWVDKVLEALPRRHRDILLALRIGEQSRRDVAARHRVSTRRVDMILQQTLKYCVAWARA